VLCDGAQLGAGLAPFWRGASLPGTAWLVGVAHLGNWQSVSVDGNPRVHRGGCLSDVDHLRAGHDPGRRWLAAGVPSGGIGGGRFVRFRQLVVERPGGGDSVCRGIDDGIVGGVRLVVCRHPFDHPVAGPPVERGRVGAGSLCVGRWVGHPCHPIFPRLLDEYGQRFPVAGSALSNVPRDSSSLSHALPGIRITVRPEQRIARIATLSVSLDWQRCVR